ncbi:MAG: methyltransferase domain-containing protein [Pseudomonadota bacterium]
MVDSGTTRYLAYLNWIFNPLHGLGTSAVYDLLATTSAGEHGFYLNLGYWNGAETMVEASDALAMLVAEAGGMGPGDVVLDCGFGFGDQDLLWAQRARPDRIIGLNITGSQVERARQRVAEAGLDDLIDLREGSATAMPIEDGSIDLVVSLESAFHYRTREDFFREAFRVLRPGGRLVTADILPLPPAAELAARLRQRLSWWLVASKFVIPKQNAYGLPEYRRRLAAAGFEVTQLRSIRGAVYAPLHRFIAAHPERLERLHPVARIPARMALRRSPDNVYAGLDYVLASARKR